MNFLMVISGHKKLPLSELLSVGTGINEKIYRKFFIKNQISDKKYISKKKSLSKDLKNIRIEARTRFLTKIFI